jgi:class 3 adenylate cyclase/tetratricopeptide (TPR) repeat protein
VSICASCGRESEGDFAFCPYCGAELEAAPPTREQRKTVTVLFCDVSGSTALGESTDPEAVRALLARYFERMKGIVEAHEGTVEKFIGDAVMAVFGVPRVHEDDAFRAVRAACEMRDALPGLGVQARIGLSTGEVVTGTEERLATGDAVNVAARLEQAAQPGEILIGETTLTLVRDAVETKAVEPLELKGKAKPVPAHRLLRVGEAPERPHKTRFVGREREFAIVRQAWERVCLEQGCELVTVVAEAGVGKSRLVAEVLASIEARIVAGRCLPYGDGITYWPVVEVLKQLDALPPEDTAREAIRSLLGEAHAATSAEEIAWAFRKTLEHAATKRPLVVVFDDVNFGEESFLDLIEHVALLSSGAPILLICMARPELLERRPTWPVTLWLEPLRAEDVELLISGPISGELREKIARAAGGNPLFLEEMLAMVRQGQGEVVVPPTLQALLAARLDQLEAAERSVLERCAVEGEIFHRGAVQALAPHEARVTSRLAALVRKEMITPAQPLLAGEEGFRFRHLLIRDAAYDAVPKAVRVDLHERFARWLQDRGASLVELDELLGYHLEQAHSYRAELGAPDATLAAAARSHLAEAGRRARWRGDHVADVSLLERAAALVPPDEFDLAVEAHLVESLYWGGNFADASDRASANAERAAAAGDRVAELSARIQEARIRTSLEPEAAATEELAALAELALPVFEAARDDLALHIAHGALGHVANIRGQMDAMFRAYEKAALHAELAGLPDLFVGWRHTARLGGTTPVSKVLAWQAEQETSERRNAWARARQAQALAMLGRFDEARAILSELSAQLSDHGSGISLAGVSAEVSLDVELLAGDPAAAVEFGKEGCRLFEELGEKAGVSFAAMRLAEALYVVGRLKEAEVWADRAAELVAPDDASMQMLSRQVRAKVLARRGDHLEAEQLAREAVALGDETEMLDMQGDAYTDLAEVLALADRPEEAAEALEQALARYECKEDLVKAGRARDRLAALRERASI